MKKIVILLIVTFVGGLFFFSSCHKDDDGAGNDSEIAGSELAAKTSVFSGTIKFLETDKQEVFSTSSAELSIGKSYQNYAVNYKPLFSNRYGFSIKGENSNKTLTIYCAGNDTYTIAKGTYTTSLKNLNSSELSNAIENYLKGGTLSEDYESFLEEEPVVNVLVTYQIDNALAGETNFYYSTVAAVNLSVYNGDYITGSFAATLKNLSGDTFKITDGVFNVIKKD